MKNDSLMNDIHNSSIQQRAFTFAQELIKLEQKNYIASNYFTWSPNGKTG